VKDPKLKVLDIPEDGMAVTAKAASDRWFSNLIQETFGEKHRKEDPASLKLDLLRTYNHIRVSGEMGIDLHPQCDRCLEIFKRKLTVSVETNLVPFKEVTVMEGETELDVEDVSFSSYKGEEIDLAVVLREALMLDMPIRYLCKEECKGLCPQCGKNLNTGKCPCKPVSGNSGFAVLKDLLKS